MSSPTKTPSVFRTSTVVVSAIFPALSLLSVILRYKARHKARQTIQADDWWIAISWVFTLSTSIIVWVFVPLTGLDYLKGNPLATLPKSTQGLWIQSLMLQLSLSTIKISILCFYKRIFSTPTFRRAADFGIAVLVFWGVIYFFLILFQVDPISGSWTGKGRTVINSTRLNESQAGTSIVLDFLVLCFPLPMIYRLHMALNRKVAVAMIFWLGGFCCIAAICRLAFLVQGQSAAAHSKSDNGYAAIADDAITNIFVTVEPNCSIIAACLPCYGPLVDGGRFLESIIRSVRVVLSLGSRGSESRRGDTKITKSSHLKLKNADCGDSQVEFHQASREWAQRQSEGHSVTNVESQAYNPNTTDGIELTHTVETRSDMA